MSSKKKPAHKTHTQKTSSPSAPKTTKTVASAPRKPTRKHAKKSALSNPTNLALLALAVIAVIAVVVILVTRPPAYTNSLPDTISLEEAYQKYQAGTFVLDVRTQAEWDEYHIPNTTLIPVEELESRLDELPQDQEIVVICRSGNRSQDGRDILLQNGFTAVTSVEVGIKSWSAAGYPVEGTPPQ